ncbi:MAG TPA: hypothetical protein ENI82_00990 [Bacteroidetes bacterium]|nr:hypothetical protein [Bacteroidota bacterium]
MKKYYIHIFVLVVLSFSSCKRDKNLDNKSEVSVIRYDELLFDLDTMDIKSSFDTLYHKYPAFTDIYFENVVPLAGYKSDSVLFYKELKRFITDTAIIKIEDLVQKTFGNMEGIESEFNSAFENLKKAFPEAKTPVLYSYISAFAIQRFIFEDGDRDGLAFGLDLFLGDNFPYNELEHGQNTFSNYLVRTYNKQHLVKKVLELWVDDKLGDPPGNRAIDAMIKNGKKLYVLKQLIPEISDTVLLEYTPSQLEWLGKNEREMWTFYIENNLFYTTDSYKIKRLTSPAPNSQALGMPTKSPGETGNYLGYKIVSEFMKRQGEMSLKDLINYKDSQKLMERSRFKPQLK